MDICTISNGIINLNFDADDIDMIDSDSVNTIHNDEEENEKEVKIVKRKVSFRDDLQKQLDKKEQKDDIDTVNTPNEDSSKNPDYESHLTHVHGPSLFQCTLDCFEN